VIPDGNVSKRTLSTNNL